MKIFIVFCFKNVKFHVNLGENLYLFSSRNGREIFLSVVQLVGGCWEEAAKWRGGVRL